MLIEKMPDEATGGSALGAQCVKLRFDGGGDSD